MVIGPSELERWPGSRARWPPRAFGRTPCARRCPFPSLPGTANVGGNSGRRPPAEGRPGLRRQREKTGQVERGLETPTAGATLDLLRHVEPGHLLPKGLLDAATIRHGEVVDHLRAKTLAPVLRH